MGNCGGSAKDAATRAIDKEMEAAANDDGNKIKLLLLGAGESGKSTIFKQMRILYGEGFDEKSREGTKPVIIGNLLMGTWVILQAMDDPECLAMKFTAEDALEARTLILATTDNTTVLTKELGEAVKLLWQNDDFQKAYDLRSNYQLFDGYKDFAKKCTKDFNADDPKSWGGAEWIPSVSDTLNARVRTSGIVEETYKIDGCDFVMFDVGGQRNERKKWIHCFENVTCIIFVGAISEYDQVLYEDNSMNRLIEARDLFGEICNSKWFVGTSIILFLNKRDLFEDKWVEKRIPMNTTGLTFFDTAPMYNESLSVPENLQVGHQWILQQFLDTRQDPDKDVYFHITMATDSNNIQTVFNACKEIILKNNLRGSGFLDD